MNLVLGIKGRDDLDAALVSFRILVREAINANQHLRRIIGTTLPIVSEIKGAECLATVHHLRITESNFQIVPVYGQVVGEDNDAIMLIPEP